MDLTTRKYNFIQKLFEVDENVFEKLEQLLNTNKETKSISLEQYNTELNQADLRIEKGDFYSNEDVEKMTSQW